MKNAKTPLLALWAFATLFFFSACKATSSHKNSYENTASDTASSDVDSQSSHTDSDPPNLIDTDDSLIDSQADPASDTIGDFSTNEDSETDSRSDDIADKETDSDDVFSTTDTTDIDDSETIFDPVTDTGLEVTNIDSETESETGHDTDSNTNPAEDTEDAADTSLDTDTDTVFENKGEPIVVVSFPDHYFIETLLNPFASQPADAVLSVDQTIEYQTFEGFGGTFNEKGWEALSYLDESTRQNALALCFDPKSGMRLVFGRLPIGASDYSLERYSLDDEENDFSMNFFSIEKDRKMLIPYIRAALAHQPKLRLSASPWTPPPWMKTNRDYDSGTLLDSPEIKAAYALYLARFVEAYRDEENLEIEAVDVQNEPCYEESYPSCRWTPELFLNFVLDYMGPVFTARGIPAQIRLGNLSNEQDHQYAFHLMADKDAAAYIRSFGVQWDAYFYTPDIRSAYPSLSIFQTEHVAGNFPWQTKTFIADRPPNDHAYGEFSFQQILLYLKAGVNAYLAWNLVLDETGLSLDTKRPWPQNSPLTVVREKGELKINPAYFAFRHFGEFIEPGAVRLAVENYEDAVAFRNPDDTIVVAAENTTDLPKTIDVDAGGPVGQIRIPAKGWATLRFLPKH